MWRKLHRHKPRRLFLGILMAVSMSTGLAVATQTGAEGHNYHTVPACTHSQGRAYQMNPHCGQHQVP